MANNLLAYPFVERRGRWDDSKPSGSEMNCNLMLLFLAMGMVVILVAPILEELLCRAIIPRLIFRGAEPIGYLAGALFLRTYMDRVP